MLIYYDSLVQNYKSIIINNTEAMDILNQDLNKLSIDNKELEGNNIKLRKQRNCMTYCAGGSTLLCILMLILII